MDRPSNTCPRQLYLPFDKWDELHNHVLLQYHFSVPNPRSWAWAETLAQIWLWEVCPNE
jgi:hypothetical protein